MGRPRKPTAILKLEGDYYACRHGDRSGEPNATGEPQKPDDMTGAASDHWDLVVLDLIAMGVVKRIDQPALEELCQWYAQCVKFRSTTPMDYRMLTMWACAHKQWRMLASRFGLTPSDRAGLNLEPDTKQDSTTRHLA